MLAMRQRRQTFPPLPTLYAARAKELGRYLAARHGSFVWEDNDRIPHNQLRRWMINATEQGQIWTYFDTVRGEYSQIKYVSQDAAGHVYVTNDSGNEQILRGTADDVELRNIDSYDPLLEDVMIVLEAQ